MTDFSAARASMVESQIRTSDVTDLDILGAFRRTARETFVPTARMALSYADCQVETDEGRTMLSPRDLSKMIQAADIEPQDVVLDIACGRGYSTAILAQLADTVVGLETDEAAVARATELLVDADIANAAVVQGDLKSGAAEHGPFDVIFISAALPSVHRPWFSQLANGGRLVCIIQSGPSGVPLFSPSPVMPSAKASPLIQAHLFCPDLNPRPLLFFKTSNAIQCCIGGARSSLGSI